MHHFRTDNHSEKINEGRYNIFGIIPRNTANVCALNFAMEAFDTMLKH